MIRKVVGEMKNERNDGFKEAHDADERSKADTAVPLRGKDHRTDECDQRKHLLTNTCE